MTRFHEEARRLIADGADPRRGGPAAVAYLGHSWRLSVRQALLLGVVLGGLSIVLVAVGCAWALGLRLPSHVGRQAAISAEPTGAVPVIPALTATDAAVIGQLVAALQAVPEHDRARALADLLKLRAFLNQPAAMRLGTAIADLSLDDQNSLALPESLGEILHWLATVPASDRSTLSNLDMIAIHNAPARRELFRVLSGLDPISAQLCAVLPGVDAAHRPFLPSISIGLTSGPEALTRLTRLAAALNAGNPALIRFADKQLAACMPDHAGAGGCR